MRLKFGKEKFGKEKRSRFGKELAVAAPMTARANKDTIIAGTRLEAPCCAASGSLSPCVSLSGVSATCVPYVSAQSQDFPRRRPAKQKRAAAWTIHPRLSRDSPPNFSLNHGLIWLMIGYSRPSRLPPVAGRSSPAQCPFGADLATAILGAMPAHRPGMTGPSPPAPVSAACRHGPGSRPAAGSGAAPRSPDRNACW